MDRVYEAKKRQILNLALVVAALIAVAAALAGKLANAGEPEEYPQSRFGQPPARVGLGVDSAYAGREADHWQEGQDAAAGGPIGRSPASDSGGARKQDQSQLRRTGLQEVALIAGDLGFFPKTIFVSRDVPVRLYVTGSSKNTLCLMMDSFEIRKQVRSQRVEEISFTPKQPGKFRFYCPVNGMEGTLIVKELSNSGSASRTPASEPSE